MENVGGVEQPKRIVVIFYVLAAIAVGVFFERILALVFSYARVNDFAVLGDWTLSTIIGFGLAIVLAVGLWRLPKTQQVSLRDRAGAPSVSPGRAPARRARRRWR